MRQCIFCGARAGSREHIFAEWILEKVPLRNLRGFLGRKKNLKIDGAWITRSVCGACNSGWMSNVEGECAPIMGLMLLDQPRFLDERAQLLVSRWALKTAMVTDSTTVTPERPLFYTREERTAIKDSGAIPERSFVWLGRDLDPGYAAASTGLSYAIANPIDPHRVIERTTGHVTTFLVGSLAIQVVTVRVPAPYSNGAIRLSPTKGPWDELLVSIWPPRRNAVYWPPVLAFTDAIPGLQHARILRTRWNVGTEKKTF